MSTADILCDVVDGVATVTLNRPDFLNALSTNLLDTLLETIMSLKGNGTRAMVLTGAGRAFSSGADLGSTSVLGDMDLGYLLERHYVPVINAILDADFPVIAAVNGAAAGAGCSLALACDLLVNTRSSYFLLAFGNIGLVPDAGATWFVPRLVGQARAAQMMLLGERIPAEQALDWGLTNYVVDDDAALARAQELAQRLARGPTIAYNLIRKQLRLAQQQSLADSMRTEMLHQRIAGVTADFAEGVKAFTEKRPANFQGK